MMRCGIRRRGRRVLTIALSLALGTLACGRDPGPPSVVVILIDTLRSDFVGALGFQGPSSPHIDALAGESVVFRRAYSQAPWTKPSVASLFCSVYPGAHGVTDHEGRLWSGPRAGSTKGVLDAESTTMAELFRDAGYRTAGFVANPWITREHGFAQGFDVFVGREELSADSSKVLSEVVLQRAAGFLREVGGGDRPWFLYIHLMDVHGPYDAPPEYYEPLAAAPGSRSSLFFDLEEFKRIPRYLRQPYWVVDERAGLVTTWRGRYAAGLRYVDERLGRFLEQEVPDVLDDAWLVITSDHGEELYEHGGWDHGGTLYEEQIHVPLILRPPGGLDRGRTCGHIVRLLDVLPTVLARAGVPVPGSVKGSDLRPHWVDDDAAESRATFAMAATDNPGLFSLNLDRYKLILDARDDVYVLFDLDEDPGETKGDLGARKPQLARELQRYLRAFIASQEAQPLFGGEEVELTPEQVERLKSLGYMN